MKTVNPIRLLIASLLVLAAGAPAWPQQEPRVADHPKFSECPIQLETKTGKIDGTLDLPAGAGPFPVVIIIAGSGPTDRDGNQPAMKNDSLKQLGQGLAKKGIAALRYDRRGIGKSAAVQPKEDDLRFEMLAGDVVEWIKLLRKDARFSRVGVVGHSEGSLVGMLAAKQGAADAFVALAGCGRPASEVLRWQLAKNLPKALAEKSDRIIDELVAGRTVADTPKELAALFRPRVQPYLISYFKYDPAREVARLEVPVLIVQGTTDLQTPVDEAKLLAQAKKDAQLCVIEGMNHVLKRATTAEEQRKAYVDPSVPLEPMLVEEVSAFLSKALAKVRVLIIDGQNNHNWKATTPYLKQALEASNRFTVEVATAPERLKAPAKPKKDNDPVAQAKYQEALAKFKEEEPAYKAALARFRPDLSTCDVVLSNYNGDLWSPEFQKDLEDAVKIGKVGLVVFHAANNPFAAWPEFNRMIGMGWRGNTFGDRVYFDAGGKEVRQTKGDGLGAGETSLHPFRVTIRDAGHPITQGLPPEWMHTADQLVHGLRGPIENVHVLATAYSDKDKRGTGEHEPMMWTVTYGKGRVFHTPMGHDVVSLRCVGLTTVLLRGTEWAATGTVTIPVPSDFPTSDKTSSVAEK